MNSIGLLAVLLVTASATSNRAAQVSDYIFVKGRLASCQGRYLQDTDVTVDYARVSENGEATFLNGTQLAVLNRQPEDIARLIADEIANTTGKKPESLIVEVIPGQDQKYLADSLLAFAQQLRFPCGKPSVFTPMELPDAEAQLLIQVEPYAAACHTGIPGYVELSYTIGRTGKPTDIVVSKSEPSGLYDDTTVNALKKWRFRPRVKDRTIMVQEGMIWRFDYTLRDCEFVLQY